MNPCETARLDLRLTRPNSVPTLLISQPIYEERPLKTATTFSDQVDEAIRYVAPDYLRSSRCDPALIDLSKGEARINWPAGILTELRKLGEADLRYQDPRGSPKLREAYLAHAAVAQLGTLDTRNCIVTAGAKQALWLAFASNVRAGDRVLLPRPGWAPYEIWARTFGASVLFYDPRELSAEALLSALSSRRCEHVLVNSPNNPTGTEYDQATVDRIAAIATDAGITLISDEVYRELGHGRASFLAHIGNSSTILVADSISKTAAAAGLRIGFLTGADKAIDAALAVRATIDSCPAGPSQSIAAFLLSPDAFAFRQDIRQFAQASVAALATILLDRGLMVESAGGLYVWVATTGDDVFVELAPELVACGVSGRSFGLEGYVRLCPVHANERIISLLGMPPSGLVFGR